MGEFDSAMRQCLSQQSVKVSTSAKRIRINAQCIHIHGNHACTVYNEQCLHVMEQFHLQMTTCGVNACHF